MKLIIFLFGLIIFESCAQNATDVITLIPKDYIGPVLITLDVENGSEKMIENGKRVYIIPSSGILRTQFQAEYGYHFRKFYYLDQSGSRNEIPIINTNEKPVTFDKDSIYVFGERHPGTGFRIDENGGEHKINPKIIFYVGKYEDANKKYFEMIQFSSDNSH